MAAPCFLVLVVLAATASSARSAIAPNDEPSSISSNSVPPAKPKLSATSNWSCFPAERAALLAFKAGITSDPQNLLISWQQGHHDCCWWGGVTCSSRTGHVVKLDLRNCSPTPIEDELFDLEDPHNHSLRGQVSSSLLALRLSLRHLDLSMNTNLGDAMAMPGFLSSFQSLTYLNLSNMGFNARLGSLEHLNMASVNLSGVDDWFHTVNALPNLVVLNLDSCWLDMSNAPSSVRHHNLTVLEELDISDNSLNTLPASNWFWDVTSLKSLTLQDYNNIKGMTPETLEHMCNLKSLRLDSNNIGMDITKVLQKIPICSWKNLQELSLMDSNITGTTLQFVSNLTSIRILEFSFTKLSGSVPVEIGKLTNLNYLNLGYNNLSGVISEDHFSGLVHLKIIDLSHNNLELVIDSRWAPPFNLDSAFFKFCHLGPQFPKWLQGQQSINHLDISSTGLISRIPDWFWTAFSDARLLDTSLNQLSGNLPLSLEFMSVIVLSMQSNLLTGFIPKLPRTIVVLDISKNSLNGVVPNFQAAQLQVAVLFSNSITGTIPMSICRLRELRVLDLSNNFLSAELPDCGRKELKQRNPFINNSSRVNSTSSSGLKIITLLLSNNSLSSGFPLFTQQCPNLVFLDLTQNKFTGELPGWNSEAMPRLVMLRSIQNLKALTGTTTTDNTIYENPFEEIVYGNSDRPYMGEYNDSLSVVIKGQVLEYRKNTIYLVNIDLCCNSLTGEIPEELSALAGLVSLNLSSNLLSGNVPYKIGKLRSLESLDLSKNTLSGEIPQGLSDLTYLSYLNLSYNNLSGRIPSGYQLDILKADDPASMYIGNPGLCGHPIPRECPGPPTNPVANNDLESWSEDGLFQIDFVLGSGFVAGTWMASSNTLSLRVL
ncbi:hypothetical protein QYE76_014975 [Lolium multiflorum]|uniref:Leucine-rich repeat-containing N-terminal plant-type domain-containing protein n=1 Tax=Lolium multiflorum TaxID=4521 RepID=A0AAD8U5W6_LOLMU|nr:hypothetical protein QYE76_014975 [Lolium multiflorum]